MVRKLPAVVDFLNARTDRRSFAWIDDHVNFEARRFGANWSRATLLARTDRELGLTKIEFDELIDFAVRTT